MNIIALQVVRETTVSAAPYMSWVILHKENAKICDAFCSCPAGYVIIAEYLSHNYHRKSIAVINTKLLLIKQMNEPNLLCRVRGSCKHVAGICHHIIATIARGENLSVTSREQAWDLPSAKHQHESDFLRNITIKKN